MFSTKKLAALAAASIAFFAAGTALADPMVVRSSGPSAGTYPVGKKLTADAKLSLKPGDVITVLDSKGTRVLKGPGVVSASGSGASTGSGFTALLANTGARQSRTGATRSAIGGGPARSPNVWYIDASRGGAQCVADAGTLSIWRPDPTAEGTVTVTSVSDGKTAEVGFRVGQSVRGWPAEELPVVDGAQYKLTVAGAAAPVTLKVAMITPDNSELDGVATALLAKGCSNQMDVLVEGSKQESGPELASK